MIKNTLDQNRVKHSFNHAAKSYDGVSTMQKDVGQQMLERLDYIKIEPATILDLGCGTGYFSEKLRHCYPGADIISLDIAYNMALYGKEHRGGRFICADGCYLPFQDNSMDLIFSSMAIHWFADLELAIREIKRVLRPNGLILFSTLGPDTLKELRKSWQRVDSYAHVNQFLDMHIIGDLFLQNQFTDPVMDMEYLRLDYDTVFQLMGELKSLGVHNSHQQRRHGLTGKGQLKSMQQAYEDYRDDTHKLPATYEVIYGHAWGAQEKSNTGTCAEVSIDSMLRNYHEK